MSTKIRHFQKKKKKDTPSFQKSQSTRFRKNPIYEDKTQHAHFWGNLLYQATKQHLNNS